MRQLPNTRIVRLAFLLTSAFVLGCGAGDVSGEATVVHDSMGILIVENDPAAVADTCAAAPDPIVDIGTVEGPEEYAIYDVSAAARLSDGRIALVNRSTSEIRVYDAEGRFLHAFGREGGGPGEFRSVFLLWTLPGDTLLVADYRPWRYSVFTPEGEFVRSFEPTPAYPNPPTIAGVLSDGGLVLGDECCLAREPGFHEERLHVVYHSADGGLVDTVGVYPYGRWGRTIPELRFSLTPLFEPRTSVGIGGQRIVAGRAEEREVEVVRPDGTLERFVRWTGEDREVRPANVEAYRQNWRARARDMPPRARRSVEARITEERPVNEQFPAYSSVHVTRGGRVWVQEYMRPSDPTRQGRWLVFDKSGAFVCHASLPEDLEVFEIGRDYVLGKEEEELDIEHVRIYDVTAPT